MDPHLGKKPPFAALSGVQPDGEPPSPELGRDQPVCEWHSPAEANVLRPVAEGKDCSLGCGGMLVDNPPFAALSGVQPEGESPPPPALGMCEWHGVAEANGLPAVKEGEDPSSGCGLRPPAICGWPLIPPDRCTAVDISPSAVVYVRPCRFALVEASDSSGSGATREPSILPQVFAEESFSAAAFGRFARFFRRFLRKSSRSRVPGMSDLGSRPEFGAESDSGSPPEGTPSDTPEDDPPSTKRQRVDKSEVCNTPAIECLLLRGWCTVRCSPSA